MKCARREYSWKTGLYYFRARWYDPVTGRFLSKDPIGISGGLNQYVFCGNNPLNFTDPLGLATYGGKWKGPLMEWEKEVLASETAISPSAYNTDCDERVNQDLWSYRLSQKQMQQLGHSMTRSAKELEMLQIGYLGIMAAAIGGPAAVDGLVYTYTHTSNYAKWTFINMLIHVSTQGQGGLLVRLTRLSKRAPPVIEKLWPF